MRMRFTSIEAMEEKARGEADGTCNLQLKVYAPTRKYWLRVETAEFAGFRYWLDTRMCREITRERAKQLIADELAGDNG